MPFNIGAPELIIILIIALVVIGPGRLPDVGAALGKSIREFRKASSDLTEATRVDTGPVPATNPTPPNAPASPPSGTVPTAAPAPTPQPQSVAPSASTVPAPVPMPQAPGDDETDPAP